VRWLRPRLTDTSREPNQEEPVSQAIREEELQEELAAYEAHLRRELGVPRADPIHFRRPVERPFLSSERARVTILFGGLTRTHDYVLRAAAEGLGYRVQDLPVPDNAALAIGKEFCNRGQCNPTYYTVGNLVKYLDELRAQGVEDIEDSYVFLTAGACGPCRFGMYEAEYRKALTDAGYPRFRVLIFQQSGGLQEGTIGDADFSRGDGITLNLSFFTALIRGLIASDIVNTMAHRVRPYEIEPGATDRVLFEAREMLAESFRRESSVWMTLRRIRKLYDTVPVDYTRPKPKVRITGEFWAQTTEGDGSYRLQSWLESEGAEVLTEPVGTWIDYILWRAFSHTKERLGLVKGARRRLVMLWLGLRLYKSFYTFYRSAVSFRTEPLASQKALAQAADDYYNIRIGGGEGHMEVGKHILSVQRGEAHMVMSIKPFGCMPSTQSDGVQSRVVADLKDSIFLPIETSGDGEASVKSRVQMKLYEAKARAREELQGALDDYGVTIEAVREYARAHPHLLRPMQRLPHIYVGTAPDFVASVAQRMPRALRRPKANRP
jgi:predicted nucleotide-binding protein (sugar kinase/HSP70/actin superfamily)